MAMMWRSDDKQFVKILTSEWAIVLYGGKIPGMKLIILFSQTVDTIGT
jgi:hypothetical protein